MADLTLMQKVFKSVFEENRYNGFLSPRHKKIINDIISCQTAAAGISIEYCDHCQAEFEHYQSCGNPYCNKCKTIKKELWVLYNRQYILEDIPYFHVIFTVPALLNVLFLLAPKFMYNLLFKAASETMDEFGRNHLNADKLGYMATLHTWSSSLVLHPHLHFLVAGCGLDKNGGIILLKDPKFLFPAKAVAAVFKGKFLSGLKKSFPVDCLSSIPNQLQGIIDDAYSKTWNVEIKLAGNQGHSVMEYIGRYINRVAISNSRILSYEDGKVRFKYKDYKTGIMNKVMELTDEEFVRRYMLHILPTGFRKTRFYGFWGYRNRDKRFEDLNSQIQMINSVTDLKKQTFTPKKKEFYRCFNYYDVLDKVMNIPIGSKERTAVCPECERIRKRVVKINSYRPKGILQMVPMPRWTVFDVD